MDTDFIIVQAGGRGTRLEHLTKNKPKSLVPINNLPILFHLFNQFPQKKFIIIGDYKIDVLREYLRVFAKVKYLVVDATENKGTCAGIRDAVSLVPVGKSFMLIWSDLILPKEFVLPKENKNYIGISKGFPCRWKYEDHVFTEEKSVVSGVAGLFVFQNKYIIQDVLMSGEFVRWLQDKNMRFEELPLYQTKEFGLMEEYKKLEVKRCRPFNKMTIKDNILIKEGIDEQGKMLALREKNWYKFIQKTTFHKIPRIDCFEPLTMEKINGKSVFEYNFDFEKKRNILKRVINTLKELHELGHSETDYFSMQEAYISKTYMRLDKVRDLIPFANDLYINVNGIRCRNIFFFKKEFELKASKLKVDKFQFLHGDCTFSNIMLKEDISPILIDPRGYFGFMDLYGDAAYDWAKLYYSIRGNYDQFNIKKFQLDIGENKVCLKIQSNNWENMEEEFFHLLEGDVSREQIKLIHAIIWLSLTTYAWEDYDSICAAFYNGLYYLEEIL